MNNISAEHKFNKQNAQIITHQINSFLVILKAYCDKYHMYEGMDIILIVLKYLLKLSDSLCCELDTWEIINIDYK